MNSHHVRLPAVEPARLDWTVPSWICFVSILLAGIGSMLALPINHDVGWTIEVGRRILERKTLYVDVVDVHPPLIFWFGGVAAWIGRVLGIGGISGYKLLVLATIASGLWMAAGWLRAPAAVGALAFVLLPWAGFDSGQGEHLFVALGVPYVLMVEARVRGERFGGWRACLAGVMAGLAFAMKPFFVAVFVALESYVLVKLGRRALVREEAVAAAGVLLAYAGSIALFTGEYFDLLPMALALYPHYLPTTLATLLIAWPVFVLAEVALLLRFAPRMPAETRNVMVLTIAALVLTVLLQRKGFWYHWYPATACALLLLFRAFARHRVAPVVLVLLTVAGIAVSHWRWHDLRNHPYYLPQMLPLVAEAGGPVLALSTIMQSAHPLVVYAGTTSASRFGALWPATAAYRPLDRAESPQAREEAGALRSYLLSAVAEDLASGCPAVMILDLAPLPDGRPGDALLHELMNDARFRREFARFREIATVADRYRVYRRTATPPLSGSVAADPCGPAKSVAVRP